MTWTKESQTAAVDIIKVTKTDYDDLKDRVRGHGLFAKRPLNYSANISITLAFLAASIASLVIFDSILIHLLNASSLAFIFGQLTFFVHDAGHNQIFRSGSRNRIATIWLSSLLLGGGSSWWVEKHNRHHAAPNIGGSDPDVDIPILAFSNEAALSKKGVLRLIAKYQVFLFFPILLLEAFNLKFNGINHLRKKRLSDNWDTIALILIHNVIYFGLLFYFLGTWEAIAFFIVHHALLGLYLGSTFATNHIGMPVLNGNEEMDYVRLQTLTARNLKANWLTSYVFGGLDSQIEHHLFPTIPRASFGELRKIVRQFCKERSIKYHEVSLFSAYLDVMKHLYQAGSPLRRGA